MIPRIKTNLIKYFFFGNSITDDGYLRLAYLLGRFLVFLPLSICATLVLGIYSIFRPVKIFILRCDRSKISFIVSEFELALRIESYNNSQPKTKIKRYFAVLDCQSPNQALTAMYRRVLPFFDNDQPFLRGILRYVFPTLRIEKQYLRKYQQLDQLEIWAERPPSIFFNSAERSEGSRLNKKLFGDNAASFITIGISEKSYYTNEHKPIDIKSRNIELCMPIWDNYFSVCNELILRGERIVRMGKLIDGPLPLSANSQIIDYAKNHRSEFGDIWLLGNCKFVIAGGTGLYWVSSAFNKPSVLTDCYNLHLTSFGPQDLCIPQLAWSRSEKKLKTLEWIFAQGDGWGHKRSLIEGDIEIVKNSAEEITEVVLEMDQRLNGTWIETDEDIELQNRFRKLRDVVPKNRVQESVQIGADFLRRYQHLL